MSQTIATSAGTIVAYGDIACPWSHLSVHRLFETRERLGLTEAVTFDLRAFSLEFVNSRPTPYKTLSAEIPVVAKMAPDAGWQVWQEPLTHWPVSTLLALEACEAAKDQSLEISAQLGRALRVALFGESQCITMRNVILDVAATVDGLNVDTLTKALDDGRCRKPLMDEIRSAADEPVDGSPHLFLNDGSDFHNPGVEMHWMKGSGVGFPVVDSDDPSVYERILQTAALDSQPANL